MYQDSELARVFFNKTTLNKNQIKLLTNICLIRHLLLIKARQRAQFALIDGALDLIFNSLMSTNIGLVWKLLRDIHPSTFSARSCSLWLIWGENNLNLENCNIGKAKTAPWHSLILNVLLFSVLVSHFLLVYHHPLNIFYLFLFFSCFCILLKLCIF